MTPDPDDALRWEGDDADAPIAPAKNAPPAAPPAMAAAEVGVPSDDHIADPDVPALGDAAASDAAHHDDHGNGAPATGNAALVFYGIIGGVYLLFAVGWIVGGFRLRPRASLLLADWMYFPWMWLAALAPVLWFAATWVLTRGRATWIRIVVLIAGAALLVPWPFVMFGMVGA